MPKIGTGWPTQVVSFGSVIESLGSTWMNAIAVPEQPEASVTVTENCALAVGESSTAGPVAKVFGGCPNPSRPPRASAIGCKAAVPRTLPGSSE